MLESPYGPRDYSSRTRINGCTEGGNDSKACLDIGRHLFASGLPLYSIALRSFHASQHTCSSTQQPEGLIWHEDEESHKRETKCVVQQYEYGGFASCLWVSRVVR